MAPSIVAAFDEAAGAVMLDEGVPPLALMRLFVHAQNLERHDRVGRNLDVLLVILREHVTAARAERTANVRADHLTDNVADDHPANGTGNFLARVALGVGLHLRRATVDRVGVAGRRAHFIDCEFDPAGPALACRLNADHVTVDLGIVNAVILRVDVAHREALADLRKCIEAQRVEP